ncbi:MAG: hypothetical protein Q8S04_11525 [Bacteroidales bacterium]|nr:hypothetical protein [Bacteroidales bacterium]
MKKIFLLIALVTLGLTSRIEPVSAQISLRINIGSQPLWGPSGHDYVEYYYLPEIEAYYYVPNRQYIFIENGRWVTRRYLPMRYRGFDLYDALKIVINESKPYYRHDYYKSKYSSHKNHKREIAIRDSRDSRYYNNRNHPQYQNWKREEQKRKEYERNRDERNRESRDNRNKKENENNRNKKSRESRTR